MSTDVQATTSASGAGGRAEPLMVFSSDTHVGPRPEEMRSYCPAKYRDAFEAFAETIEQYQEMFLKTTFSTEHRNGRERNLRTAGHHDPHARLRDMDRDGVAGGVIFAESLNGQPFPFEYDNRIASGVPAPEARELAGVGRSMYNRWLADFCSVEPERNVGLAQLPFWDIDAVLAELEWGAEHGLRGVNFPAPGQPGLLPIRSAEMDRFFAACASLDMTLATHIGATPPSAEPTDQGLEENYVLGMLDAGDWGLRTVYQMVIHGVFERYPNLKLVITEVPGVIWNEMCLKMDSLYKTPLRQKDHALPRLPSEYAASNVWMGNSFQSRQEAVAAIEFGHEDRFLWGSDYPHPEGTFTYPDDPDDYPMTRLSLANTYHDLPLEKVRKLVGENALAAYPRLDAGALSKVAARVGVPVDEIERAPDLAQFPYISQTGTLGFRTEGPWN